VSQASDRPEERPREQVAPGRPAMTDRPSIARGFRLQWEEVQNSWVLLYPEGMVKLNASAGEILQRCDGERTVAAIIEELESAFDAPDLGDDVTAFLEIAARQRWVQTGCEGSAK
jgi:pyrroloquinoline quinone biosynthesis protein D